ncbi:MAG: MJ0042-type zinc finger domain-containing protein, partial [Planctomycetia bacterium]
MPLPVECPSCAASYRVKDDRAGTTIKCKECGAPIKVPAAAAHDDEPAVKVKIKKKRRSSGAGVPLWLGLLVGIPLGLVLTVGLFFYSVNLKMMKRAEDARKADVEGPIGGAVAGKPAADEAEKPWTDLTDAAAEPLYVIAAERKLSIPMPDRFDEQVIFANGPLSFAVLGGNGVSGSAPQIFDLRDQRKVGVLSDKIYRRGVLSPEGRYFAFPDTGGVQVVDAAGGSKVALLPLKSNAEDFCFAGPDRIVAARRSFMTLDVDVYRLPSGELERTFSAQSRVSSNPWISASPGGRLVALVRRADVGGPFILRIFRVADGSVAGSFSLSNKLTSG